MTDLRPGGKVSRVVQFRDGVVRGVQWVNDDRLVFTVVDFSEGSGRPNGAPGLFVVDPDGRQLLQLVRRQGLPFITDGRVNDRMLELNHRLLRVPQPKGDQANEEVLIAEMSKGTVHAVPDVVEHALAPVMPTSTRQQVLWGG